ncbi:chaperone protein dnaJ 11, chloroplastic-like [Phalaenopsis equestris]|uniref:chaperone protein dnaJ 11, chloroplastic-like n=1 Tax=Phalaenopsis equestris TaxID=78828 RepID=UPI0009E44146|nr:chaperone protein dnaJ 11, chloroplastic-like [Phalaenopsis equestris]
MSAIASLVGLPSVAFRKPSRRRAVAAMASPAAETTAKTIGRGLYGVLGLREAASMGEIKAAYRSLAKRFHPDVAGGGNDGRFLEIQRAYATLSDSEEKERYDLSIGRFRLVIQRDERFRRSRRWETDQCW